MNAATRSGALSAAVRHSAMAGCRSAGFYGKGNGQV